MYVLASAIMLIYYILALRQPQSMHRLVLHVITSPDIPRAFDTRDGEFELSLGGGLNLHRKGQHTTIHQVYNNLSLVVLIRKKKRLN